MLTLIEFHECIKIAQVRVISIQIIIASNVYIICSHVKRHIKLETPERTNDYNLVITFI